MGTKELRAVLGDKVLENEAMSKHTKFAIGGPADLFVQAHTLPELRDYVRLAWEHEVPCLILGSGANLLVADKGIRGLAVSNRCDRAEFAYVPGECTCLLTVESGAKMRAVAHQAIDRGLAGLEWAVDVPGTVGGAVVGNAGAYGGYTSDNLQGVLVFVPANGDSWKPSSELGFSYRASIFKQKEEDAGFWPVILSATFLLRQEDTDSIRARALEFTRRRAERQPNGLSAGSVFKRTDQYPAGFLIENAGLKGTRVGGAIVSPKHANFILNTGTATAGDVRQLITLVREKVYDKFGVMLELEIELVGEW